MRTFELLGYRGQVGRLRRLAKAALSDYGIRDAELILLAHSENTVFRADLPGARRYALRIHRASGNPVHPRRTAGEVRSELEWLAALRRDTDLAVPEPMPTRDGQLLTVAEAEGVPEPRICALFRWINGRFLDDGLTPAHLERVGRLIARLHLHAEGYAPPEGFVQPRVADVSDEVSGYALDAVAGLGGQRDVAVVREVIRRVRHAQQELDADSGTSGLIHADLHQENYLFRAGRVKTIDFDDCGWGYFGYDLAVTLSELRGRDDYQALRAGLLRGYRAVRPLPAEHERYLAIFDALRLLLLTLWFLEQRHHPGFPQWEADVRGGLRDLEAFAQG